MTRDETYRAAIAASERMRNDGYRAAEQLHRDCIDSAHAKMMAGPRDLAALAERDRAHADASDARAYLYQEAEQRHADRLAALARRFGQHYRGPGNPAADHAQAFVISIDPDGECAAMPLPAPVGELAVIEFAGSRHERRVDERGRVVPERRQPDLDRATFTGDAAAFSAAKARGVMTPAELAAAESFRSRPTGSLSAADAHKASLATETPAAYPTAAETMAQPSGRPSQMDVPKPDISAPPPGLLADIAAILRRTAR